MGVKEIADQTIVFGVPTAIIASVGFYFKVISPGRKAAKAAEIKAQVERDRIQSEMYEVLVGKKPTDLDPHPPLGVISQTAANTEAVYNMSLRINQSNGTQKDIQRVQGVILQRLDTIAGAPPGVTLHEVKEAVEGHDEHMADRQTELLDAINQSKETPA